ncbi:MAG: NAD-dependent epimerase/dehydratase family protein [Acidobacteria bacterium]|nr:NAD-dependent epimerase/dehydratase family protein [Acidobacteriota bacterium]
MKYFLTGATGFIGGQVARQLAEAGHQVIALARDPSSATGLAALGVALHKGDVTDKESMRRPMTGVDGVFHIAAWYKIGEGNPHAAQAINVQGTRHVLELMQELKIRKGVYTSTLAVFSDTRGKVVDESYRHDGPWLSVYDRTKWAAHYEVALPMIQQGLPLVIVQPGLVYGPGDTSSVRGTITQYLQRKLPLVPKKTAFCWAHVDDTARGHVLAMEKGKPGESYIIAGPVHTLEEALDLAERITGIPAPGFRASPAVMKTLAALMRIAGSVVPLPSSYTAESLRVTAGSTYLGENSKARRELGFHPRPLEEGLHQTLMHEMSLLGMALPETKETEKRRNGETARRRDGEP